MAKSDDDDDITNAKMQIFADSRIMIVFFKNDKDCGDDWIGEWRSMTSWEK